MNKSVEINDFLWASRMFSFINYNEPANLSADQQVLDLQLFNEDLDNDDLEGADENEFYDEEIILDDVSLGLGKDIFIDQRPSSVNLWFLSNELWVAALILNGSSIFKSSFCDLAISEYFNFKFASYMFKSKATCVLKIVCAWVVNSSLLSLSSIIPALEWAEREAWDMNGVFFVGSWDLRRILTDYGFRFFPMLKQVPLSGYAQCVYDDYSKVVSYESIELSQGFRA